jgi:hypothetical protein
MAGDHKMAQILTPICHDAWARQRQTPLIAQRDTMKQPWREPTLDDLLSDPTLDALLARDGVTRTELHQVIEEARQTLARVPRSWHEGPGTSASTWTKR